MKLTLFTLCVSLILLPLTTAKAQRAKIGELPPAFSLVLADGQTINSDQLKGKLFLLDFWSSSCSPCFKDFPEAKKLAVEFKGKIQIISVSIDDPSDQERARQVVNRHQLPWLQVFNQNGEAHDVWKMLCDVGTNQRFIPYYALFDDQGRLVYADRGGYLLSELRAKIKKSLRTLDRKGYGRTKPRLQ